MRQALQLWNGNIGKAMESLEDGEAAKYSALSAELCRALVAETEYALICGAPLQKDRQAVLNICGCCGICFGTHWCWTAAPICFPAAMKSPGCLDLNVQENNCCNWYLWQRTHISGRCKMPITPC